MKALKELNLVKIGNWSRCDNLIDFQINDEMNLNIPNVLYAFVVQGSATRYIAYIGKTTQTLGKRFYGYHRGNGKSTNNKVHNFIKEELIENNSVEIWALFDDLPLMWNNISINLSAGLEDSMINKLKPRWNGSKSSSEKFESEALFEDNKIIYPVEEKILIAKTYYKSGYVNVSVKNSSYLGKHNEEIEIYLGNKNIPIISKINRSALSNRSVRISANVASIRDYYQANYQEGDYATLTVLSTHTIRIA